MPEKEDSATGVMEEEGEGRPDWDMEQVRCLVPFLWEVRGVTLCVHCAGCGGSSCLPRQPLLPALQEEEAWHVDQDGTRRGGVCLPTVFAGQSQLSLSLHL